MSPGNSDCDWSLADYSAFADRLRLAIDRGAVAILVQLAPKRSVFRTELADQLLILLDVILHRPHLVFLHAAVAGNEVAVRVALAAGDRERHERSSSESRYLRAVQSRDVRAKMQGNDLKRLRELLAADEREMAGVRLSRGI